MKKVSILTLCSILFFENIAVVAAPRRNTRRVVARARMTTNKLSNSGTGENSNNTTVPQIIKTETKQETMATGINENDDLVANIEVEDTEKTEKQSDALNDLSQKVSEAQSACSGIKHNIDTIFGLTVATTVSSGAGTLLAGGALVTGIAKANKDKKIENNYKKIENMNYDEMVEELNQLKSEIDKDTEDSKSLGNLRTGLMAGATVTSAVSTGTSLGATLTAKKLAEKMEDCDKAIANLRYALATAEAEEVEESSLAKARAISGACTGFDKDNIKTLKTQMTASAIVSGIGTATGTAGTITSIMANSKKTRDQGGKKEKNLNLASNILAGVTAGTSATSTVLSATAISKAKKDSALAGECEDAL